MTGQELAPKYCEAAEEFNRREGRQDGARVATSLDAGLSILRDSLYHRLHEDVERIVGTDSMLMPLSPRKVEPVTKLEIECYQFVESQAAAELGYLANREDWYLPWLVRLRLGPAGADETTRQRLDSYRAMPPDRRRLAFGDVLAKTFPESRRAPLVLFRLFPLAVHAATASAFGDHAGAAKIRSRQVAALAIIADCRECHGKILENGEQCRTCGNPLWKSEWLLAAD